MTQKVNRADFARRFKEGMNRGEMAAYFGVHPVTITVIRKELGLPVFAGTPKLSKELLANVERMLDDGMSFSEIRRTTGVTDKTLAKRFPGRGWSHEQTQDLIVSLHKGNKGIRKHTNHHPLTVRK